jgi:hypothetical protein
MSLSARFLMMLLILPFLPAGASLAAGLDALAVSADGKLLATGGTSRVLFLLGEDLAVRKRIWHGARIQSLAFSRDGTRLLLGDDADTLHLFEVSSGKVLVRVNRVRGLVAAAEADLAVARSLSNGRGTLLRLFSLTDGSEKRRLELKESVSAYALDSAGKQLTVLSMSHQGDEKRVPITETPRDLKGLARREFQLKNDGQVADLRVYEVPSGRVVREQTLWYTSDSDSTRLFLMGPTCWVANFNNTCARVAGDGTITLFETGMLFNHALAASPDGKVLLAGGLHEATYGAPDAPTDGPPENRRRRFTLDPLPGADEFLSAAVVRPDGSFFTVTTAYRLVQASREGKVERVVPVY